MSMEFPALRTATLQTPAEQVSRHFKHCRKMSTISDGENYLLIPGASEDGRALESFTRLNATFSQLNNISRFCGSVLNVFSVAGADHPVFTCSVPFTLHFHSEVGQRWIFHVTYDDIPGHW